MHVRIDAMIEPQILELGAEARQAFCLFRLRTEFAEVEKLAERLVAGKPSFFVEKIGIIRRTGELQIDAWIFAEQASSIICDSGC